MAGGPRPFDKKNIPYPTGQSPPGGIVNTGRAIYTRRNELLLMPLLMVCMTIMMIHFQESMVRKGSTHSCSLFDITTFACEMRFDLLGANESGGASFVSEHLLRPKQHTRW